MGGNTIAKKILICDLPVKVTYDMVHRFQSSGSASLVITFEREHILFLENQVNLNVLG